MKKQALCLLLAGVLCLCAACGNAKESNAALAGKLVSGVSNAARASLSTAAQTVPPEASEQPAPQPSPLSRPRNKQYVLRARRFSAPAVEYGTEFKDGGIFTDAYYYNNAFSVQFGRLDAAKNADEAVQDIANQLHIAAGKIDYSETSSYDVPALILDYKIGSNEDTQYCRDVAMLGDDALHWFHCAVYADWFSEYEESLLSLFDSLYLAELTTDQLLALQPGSASSVFAEIRYKDKKTILVNDLQWINGDDIEELKAHGIDPDDVYNDYAVVELGDSIYYEYPLYQKAHCSFISYDGQGSAGFSQIDCSAGEFMPQLKEYCQSYEQAAMAVDILFAGEDIIAVDEVYIP